MVECTLNDLRPGIKARIIKVLAKGTVRRKLMDMGMVPGSEIEVVRTAPLGDPIEFRIKGYSLSMRKQEAVNIVVETIA
ncbi:MAG: ferrous iron transport protein A [Methanomethylovorans sp. PtaU1.Bin093]|jgi:ferrous iron transport protein A|uniref:FeoA family protein n=1 Tax=Methanomethylovorans sp. PtaU1.Bin093 TaxID=1811679 RepID=UPI0009D2F92F|nr:ferrous iron transport protein A [Methanomethylovorans sp. PtaU1.Bin093]OPY19494.1 MAG: ferrous iron transport protein A [Methanomethylovorans sp. PtaU1.Bin093]